MHKKLMNIKEARDKEISIFEREIGKASDSIYGVLIAHLYIEHLLDRYLRTKLKTAVGLFGKGGLSFSNKLKLVRGFGELDPQLIGSISKLNSIRNNCAHLFGHQITDKEVEALGKTLGENYKSIKKTYPGAEVGAIAPIIWNVCGQVLHSTLQAEGYR
jgi:hypothetical protein